jgi:hypothetical protein
MLSDGLWWLRHARRGHQKGHPMGRIGGNCEAGPAESARHHTRDTHGLPRVNLGGTATGEGHPAVKWANHSSSVTLQYASLRNRCQLSMRTLCRS